MSTMVRATAPSNIAFVKYWGKRDAARQWPANDSISMTLSSARTVTTATPRPDQMNDTLFMNERSVDLTGKSGSKAHAQLARLRAAVAQTTGGATPSLSLSTKNTFPASCGIASSASGLMALTLAALGAWTGASTVEALGRAGFGRARLRELARLGSGSACRSLDGGYVRWYAGSSPGEQSASPLHDAAHWPLADVIVVLSSGEKAVGSTEGHAAAWTSPLFGPRLAGLDRRLSAVTKALAERDLERLGDELEAEALEMHAVMMSATPGVNYFAERTAPFLAWVREERAKGRLPAWFTLDAGPNPHLIAKAQDAADVASRVRARWGDDTHMIIDRAGTGAELELASP